MSDSVLLFCSQDPDSKLQIGGLLELMAQTSCRSHSFLDDILKRLFCQIPLVLYWKSWSSGFIRDMELKFNQCWRQSAETNTLHAKTIFWIYKFTSYLVGVDIPKLHWTFYLQHETLTSASDIGSGQSEDSWEINLHYLETFLYKGRREPGIKASIFGIICLSVEKCLN